MDMRDPMRRFLLTGLAAAVAATALAQAPTPADESTPAFLQIFREEVKPGKGAAHEANEAAWAAAYAKAKMANGWLAMTSMTGPSEAWFLTGLDSWEAWEKNNKAEEADEALTADVRRLAALDGEMLNRTSGIVGSFRPAISYQPRVNLAEMRYMSVQLVRVKPGHGRDFTENWRQVVAAHEKAKMDEHWAFYRVDSGMADGTFLYFQAYKSLAEADKAGPMHEAAAYRDVVGEDGRVLAQETIRAAVEFSQSLLFSLNPKMSYVPKSWVDADPAFWAPKPPAPAKKK